MNRIGNTPTILVIILASVGFLGLSVLQFINLDSSIDTNRKIFLQKVDLASAGISNSFSDNSIYPNQLYETENKLGEIDGITDAQMDQVFRELINNSLDDHGIDIAYEYAVYKHNCEGDGFLFVMGDEGNDDFSLVSCENPDERSHGWANLTCSQNLVNEDYHLALFFPDQDAYIFAQSKGALFLSILFIIFLLISFGYILFVLQKQKKITEIKNDFINNLTHEFKTPIASIKLASNLLDTNSSMDPSRRKSFHNLIIQESKRLESQVDKILQIAMLDSGNFSLNKIEIDIHEVITNVVESMSVSLEQRKGQISLELEADDSRLVADKTHITNIIYNLIDNALKYTMEIPEILIRTTNEDEGIKISIKDNGIGIEDEIQKFIFDKFYRAESGDIHNVKGFGLGLSYVKKMVDAHKGWIDLISKTDQGTEFQVYIPGRSHE